MSTFEAWIIPGLYMLIENHVLIDPRIAVSFRLVSWPISRDRVVMNLALEANKSGLKRLLLALVKSGPSYWLR